MELPDIVGFTLMEAKHIMAKTEFVIGSVKVTLPPRTEMCTAEDHFRVVRIEQVDTQKVELTVCKPL
ncbi:MAG: hypothetical protein N2484_18520 [Clostridia bacterium]|nr:hypothetical protein [Clostridia bacterium]